jgi:hypothetical protein
MPATKKQLPTQNQTQARTINTRSRGPLVFVISQYVAMAAPRTPISVAKIILGLTCPTISATIRALATEIHFEIFRTASRSGQAIESSP